MMVGTKHNTFFDFSLDCGNRISAARHLGNRHIFSVKVVEFKDNRITFSTPFSVFIHPLAGVCCQIIPDVLPCHFTGGMFSIFYRLEMPFSCRSFKVFFVVFVLAFTACGMPNT